MSECGCRGAGEIHKRITQYIRMRFPAAKSIEVDSEFSLLDSGVIDSLGILDLVEYIEESFEIQAADEDLVPENFETVSALVRFVESKR